MIQLLIIICRKDFPESFFKVRFIIVLFGHQKPSEAAESFAI